MAGVTNETDIRSFWNRSFCSVVIRVNDEEIMIEFSVKERIEGRKKKETIIKQEKIKFNNIKETTIIISFK